MNKTKLKIYAFFILALSFNACKESFLEPKPQGQLIAGQIVTEAAIEQLLIGAYGSLNGNRTGTWGNYASAPSQWILGEVASDNAHKGSESGDMSSINDVEMHRSNSVNEQFEVLWIRTFEGILSCNNVIKTLALLQATNGQKFTEQRAKEIQAEARMLRAHYYFLLRRAFVNVPYIDETLTTTEAMTVKNDTDIYPKIIDDLKFAIDNLPVAKFQGQSGRVNKKAAQAYLGKVYLYQNKHSEALPLFESVINASGDLTTMPFENNFQTETEDGPEVVFAVKHAKDGAVLENANVGDMLAGYYGNAPVTCCGFYQPTVDLVNSYKTDVNGLPLLDNSYRTNPYSSDLQVADKATYKLDTTLRFDPRLDYTVARRHVMFRDWGVMPGNSWIRDPIFGGPFLAQKHTINLSQFASQTNSGAEYITGLDVNIIRLADVYLMAAECYAAPPSNLNKAVEMVNKVRKRAANLANKRTLYNNNAAVYDVKEYPSFPNEQYALNAIRFERRLELALEGHRYYDLVRWGIAKQVLESYSAFEAAFLPYGGLVFNTHNAYWPIPQSQIDRSGGALEQNEGY